MSATLAGKHVIIHGGGGSIGGAIARAAAAEGAALHLAGRSEAPLKTVAEEIRSTGGSCDYDVVDALDEDAVDRHAAAVVERAGRIDVTVNAVGVQARQGVPFLELDTADLLEPVNGFVRTVFLTSRAAARAMVDQGNGGVVITLSASPARLSGPMMAGFGVACGAIETISRHLAGEWGPHGIRVVCLRPNKIGDQGDLSDELREALESATLIGRLPTLAEVADTAAFVMSDRAGPVTGAVVNLTGGAVID